MSEEELAELAEVEPAFARRAVRAGALKASGDGGFGPRTPPGCGSCGPGTPPGCRWRPLVTSSPPASCPSRSWTSRSWPPSRGCQGLVAQAPGAGLPPTHIGIHSGPVVFQDGDVYGTTVNIAARLSARAAPGEVLVSRPAADRIPHPNHLEPLGPVELKGVAQPLEVFRPGAGPAARSGPGASRW
jgi:hypothetical protein